MTATENPRKIYLKVRQILPPSLQLTKLPLPPSLRTNATSHPKKQHLGRTTASFSFLSLSLKRVPRLGDLRDPNPHSPRSQIQASPAMSSASAHPLGGASRPGRIIGPSLDKIIKNAAWRKHTHLVSACKSSLDLLQTLTDDQEPSEGSALLGLSPSDSDSLLSPLVLALDPSHPSKILDPTLDCLLKLISLRLLRGHVDPLGPTPTLSRLLDSLSSLASSAPDDAVQQSVLRLFVAAVRSDVISVRGEALVQILKSCYNAYLGSSSALNQVVSKLVLAQILVIVFARVEADSAEVTVKTVSVVDLLDLSDRSLNDANLVQAAQSFIDEAMEWSGDGGGNRGEVGLGEENDGQLSRIREDGIFLFKNLCKFSMKFAAQEGQEDPLLLRGKVLSLELLKMVMENAGPIWRTNDK